ncbi:tail assembly chaperone [Bombilactobacillus folatiphilus]|uniref:Tail assembly chaperone n=1 Tax=Bombilactobacillus folatiphilus TaxID=2923362 RepID=A0ABY4PA43_9LACO|nr:tail assembly chaperone [Bombilactobacillus folatiphilus]UQS82608.1 tail assembly chaperone [Bombilactobacillus folatiphilus]
MKLKINNQEQELNFGVRFVRELDQVAGMNMQNFSFGMGLTRAIPALKTYDPAILSDVIYCATFKNSPRVSHEAVDDFIDSITSGKELGKLFDDVNAEMNEANALKVALKNAQP